MSIWITKQETSPSERKPVAVKDLFDTSEVRTTYGSEIFADHVPSRTAVAVAQLENAGYASAGKANLHEFAYGITSQNPHFGDVPNVRFPGCVAGGSSGGCAAAIAAGEADVALGTDTGGSIRIPAACCEVTGFKPTFGLVSLDGCFPLAPSFDHAGPLATDVAGCAEMMRALVGLSLPALDSLEDIRLGIAWLDYADTEVRTVIDAAASRLPPALPVEPSLPDGVFDAFQHEVAGTHRELFELNRDRYGLNVRTKVERCIEVSQAQAARANTDPRALPRGFREGNGRRRRLRRADPSDCPSQGGLRRAPRSPADDPTHIPAQYRGRARPRDSLRAYRGWAACINAGGWQARRRRPGPCCRGAHRNGAPQYCRTRIEPI